MAPGGIQSCPNPIALHALVSLSQGHLVPQTSTDLQAAAQEEIPVRVTPANHELETDMLSSAPSSLQAMQRTLEHAQRLKRTHPEGRSSAPNAKRVKSERISTPRSLKNETSSASHSNSKRSRAVVPEIIELNDSDAEDVVPPPAVSRFYDLQNQNETCLVAAQTAQAGASPVNSTRRGNDTQSTTT